MVGMFHRAMLFWKSDGIRKSQKDKPEIGMLILMNWMNIPCGTTWGFPPTSSCWKILICWYVPRFLTVSFLYLMKSPSGWWYTYPSEKYDFVSWDDDIPNWMESHKSHVPNHHFVPLCVAHCLGVRRQCFNCGDSTVSVATRPRGRAAGQESGTAVGIEWNWT